MPPLPSKRLLEESGDEHSGDEVAVEPDPKRIREDSPEEGDSPDIDANKLEADKIVDVLMPRLEPHLQTLVNGVALRMLNALSSRLSRLESRMEEMQREWKTAVTTLQKSTEERLRQKQQFQQQVQTPHHSTTPDEPETRGRSESPLNSHQGDSLNHFLEEAAQVADGPHVVHPATNRRDTITTRRPKQFPTPNSTNVNSTHPASTRGPSTTYSPNVNALPENIPQYKLDRGLQTVKELWNEFFVGSEEKPPINELDQKYGSFWRWRNPTETTYYSLRRVIIDEIISRVGSRCPDTTTATDDIWAAVCEEMDKERVATKASLNQYIHELKRRDRMKSPPPEPPPVTDPGVPPPEPILSRLTMTVGELWIEWFEGKNNYNGYAKFPSIIELNRRFGDTWRKPRTPEYGFYLKRRCIIDIAVQRIIQIGGAWDETRAKVVREMDLERMREDLSLMQYNQWAREKLGYHAARTQVPSAYIELGTRPAGFEKRYESDA